MATKQSITRRCCQGSSMLASHCKSKSLHLVLGNDTNLRTLTHVIQCHTNLMVEEMTIEPEYDIGSNFVFRVSEPDWEFHHTAALDLFQALGELPMLKKIHLKGLGMSRMEQHGTGGFPLELLMHLLIHPMRECYLEELTLEKCRFVSDELDNDGFARAIRGLLGLRRLKWDEASAPSSSSLWGPEQYTDGTTPRASLSQLHDRCVVQAILSLRSLQNLHLAASPCHADSAPPTLKLCNSALDKFTQSSACPSLTLVNFCLDRSSMAALKHSMEHPNCTLRSLVLDVSQAKEVDVLELFQAFRTNQSVVNLGLWISHDDSWKKDQCLTALARALAQNRHVTTLRLRCHPSSSYADCSNQQAYGFSDENAYALCQMLEADNHTLTHVAMDDYQGKFVPTIKFYSKLNLSGRKQIRETMSTNDVPKWAGLLSTPVKHGPYYSSRLAENGSMHNLEAIYFWLQQNPSIITTSCFEEKSAAAKRPISVEC